MRQTQSTQYNNPLLSVDEVLQILETERKCVSRASSSIPCNRRCDKCDLVLDSEDIIYAYSWAIGFIKQTTGRG